MRRSSADVDRPAQADVPVSLAELAAELGAESVDRLAAELGADVYRDDRGFRCVTPQRARVLIAERDQRVERDRLAREHSEAVARAVGEANDRERRAVLAAVDARQARYGSDDYASGAEVVFGEYLEEKQRRAGERFGDYAGWGR